jgi:transposase InsO family protein
MAVREWIAAVGAKTAYIERGSPWENGYCESFNSKLRDELLNGEIFYTLQEAKVIIENWRRHYNTIRPHSSLGYRPPAPEAFMPARLTPQSGPAAPHALTLASRPSLTSPPDHSIGAGQHCSAIIPRLVAWTAY